MMPVSCPCQTFPLTLLKMRIILLVILGLCCVLSLGSTAAKKRKSNSCRPAPCLRAHVRDLRRRTTRPSSSFSFDVPDLDLTCEDGRKLVDCLRAANCETRALSMSQTVERHLRDIGFPCYISSKRPDKPETDVGIFVQCLNNFFDTVTSANGPAEDCPAVEDFSKCAGLLPKEDAVAFIEGLDSKLFQGKLQPCLSTKPEPNCDTTKAHCESDLFSDLNEISNKDEACGLVQTAYMCLLEDSCEDSYDADELVNGYEERLAGKMDYICDGNGDGIWPEPAPPLVIAPSGTGDRCIKDCNGLDNGDYQSCQGCSMYASCSHGNFIDKRPCPATLVWDDNTKRCGYTSATCSEE